MGLFFAVFLNFCMSFAFFVVGHRFSSSSFQSPAVEDENLRLHHLRIGQFAAHG